MTAYTKQHAKLGTTEWQAQVRYFVVVEPGERFDVTWIVDGEEVHARDDFDGDVFSTLADAERWVRRRLTAKLTKGTEAAGATIREVTFEASTFDDEQYGTVHDADEVVVETREYQSDGTLDDVYRGDA